MRKCYICSRTIISEGDNINTSHPDSELCLNCELSFIKSEKVENKILGEKLKTKLFKGK